MKRVCVVGASGYTGAEVLRLLERHAAIAVTPVSLRLGGADGGAAAPAAAPGPATRDPLSEFDAAVLCVPHGSAAELARAALERGLKVVDLSADFRLADPALYRRTYGKEHPAPELLGEAVYGLTERKREQVARARLVANPGCYPTSILLPLLPLLERGLLHETAPIIADAKSGASGAGRTPSERTLFGAVHENFCAYGVGDHRHLPEIRRHAGTDRVLFTPHLLPVFRGILSTIYVTPAPGVDAGALRAALAEAYAGERFVRLCDGGPPDLQSVQRTNDCRIHVAALGPVVAIFSALDNLVKGAAGQAVQNLNLMLGLPEAEGLR